MDYYDALGYSLSTLYTNKNLALGGSVALIFCDVLPVREVSNIDFVCLKENLPSEFLLDSPATECEECEVYPGVTVFGILVNYIALKSAPLNRFKKDGLWIQDTKDILKHKRNRGNEVDKKDLENIILPAEDLL